MFSADQQDALDALSQVFFAEIGLESLKEKFGLGESVEKQLPVLSYMIKENIHDIIESLYGFIAKDSFLRQTFLNDSKKVSALKAVNRQAVISTFTGPIDQAYVLERLAVGLKHYQIQLKLLDYTAAHQFLEKKIVDVICASHLAPHEALEAVKATSSLLTFERFLTTEAFHFMLDNQLSVKLNSTRNLIRVVTHDINNPLTIIYHFSLILQKKLEGDPLEKVQKIAKSVTAIREIIDNVRASQAIKTGKKKLNIVATPVKELVAVAMSGVEDSFATKGVHLSRQMAGLEAAKVLVAKTEFVFSVLGNLLSNALKFTHPNGEVKLEVSDDESYIYFCVIDNGIGIPESILAEIFDEGASTSRLGTSGEKGTGFGMPLVKQFVQAMQGRIEIESRVAPELNHGTRITVALPRCASD